MSEQNQDWMPQLRKVSPSPFRTAKSLQWYKSFDYQMKDQGMPCKQGERSDMTGCIPATGESPVDREEGNEEEEWDGEIDSSDVKVGSSWVKSNYAQWLDDDGTEHEMYLEDGTFTKPNGEEIRVFRFVSFDSTDDSIPDKDGDWTEDEEEAYRDGEEYAERNNVEQRDPEDSDIPDDIDGISWGSRDEIQKYMRDGDSWTVRLDEAEFEFGGKTFTAYRWSTKKHDDGEWTLDKDQAISDGEEYAEDNNEEPDEDENKDELIEKFFDGDEDNVREILGMPDDADFSFEYEDDKVTVKVKHKWIEDCERTFSTDRNGNAYIHNDILRIRDDAPQGFGSKIFSDQVEGARKSGFSYIETHAAGSFSRSETWNGYYTWPCLGYDQDLVDFGSKQFTEKVKAVFPDANSVLDIMSVAEVKLDDAEANDVREKMKVIDRRIGRPEKDRKVITGKDWWMVHGRDMVHAEFDLDEDSRSSQINKAYMKGKGK